MLESAISRAQRVLSQGVSFRRCAGRTGRWGQSRRAPLQGSKGEASLSTCRLGWGLAYSVRGRPSPAHLPRTTRELPPDWLRTRPHRSAMATGARGRGLDRGTWEPPRLLFGHSISLAPVAMAPKTRNRAAEITTLRLREGLGQRAPRAQPQGLVARATLRCGPCATLRPRPQASLSRQCPGETRGGGVDVRMEQQSQLGTQWCPQVSNMFPWGSSPRSLAVL